MSIYYLPHGNLPDCSTVFFTNSYVRLETLITESEPNMACANTNINIWVFPFKMTVSLWHSTCDGIKESSKPNLHIWEFAAEGAFLPRSSAYNISSDKWIRSSLLSSNSIISFRLCPVSYRIITSFIADQKHVPCFTKKRFPEKWL